MTDYDSISDSDDGDLLFSDAQEGKDELFRDSIGPLETSTAADELVISVRNSIDSSPTGIEIEDKADLPATSLYSVFSPVRSDREIGGSDSAVSNKPSMPLTPDQIEGHQKAFSYLQEVYRDRQGGQPGLSRIDEEEAHHPSIVNDSPAGTIVSESEGRNSSSSGGSAGKAAASIYTFVPKFGFRNPFRKRPTTAGDTNINENTALSDPFVVKMTSSRGKGHEESSHIGFKLSQSYEAHQGACWCVKISLNGKYLATCGQDSVIYVWATCDAAISALLTASLGGGKDNVEMQSPSASENSGPLNRLNEFSNDGKDAVRRSMREAHSGDSRSAMFNEFQAPPNIEDKEFDGSCIFDFSSPLQSYRDHSRDVIDLSWSSSDFLLSASVDKTVRLWHVSRSDCLKVFSHPDVVSGVAFHPIHDRFFVTGCLDEIVRYYDVASGDGKKPKWETVPPQVKAASEEDKEKERMRNMVTSVCFNHTGNLVVIGEHDGSVIVYKSDGLKQIHKIDCKKNGKTGKVSGVTFIGTATISRSSTQSSWTSNSSNHSRSLSADSTILFSTGAGNGGSYENIELLVSTSDSRIRLFRGDGDFSLRSKLKGHATGPFPIKSSAAEDGEYIISGSETGLVYIWNRNISTPKFLSLTTSESGVSQNSAYDCFNNNMLHSTQVDKRGPRLINENGRNNTDLQGSAGTSPAQIPVLCAIFGSSSLLQTILPAAHLVRLMKKHDYFKKESVASSIRSHNRNGSNDEEFASQIQFLRDFSRNIIITADYNGIIRVYTKELHC